MKNKVDHLYYLGFSYFYGIGPIRFALLLKYFGSAKKAYEANKKEISKVIGPNWAEKFGDFRTRFNPVIQLDELEKQGITVIYSGSEVYSDLLKEITDPPICLYVKGINNLAGITSDKILPEAEYSLIFKNCFAIVGTRMPTQYGQQLARKFSSELAEAGFVIVSGMALGIDAIAHQGTLDVGGRTIAVLGCGVNVVYPAANRRLYSKIIEKGGLVISEFPPDQMVVKGLFIARNRIISGLSSGVLIIEGAEDSGALITARYAAEQGREVFAPPGPITSLMSKAPNMLIKQGAKLVTSAQDIYEELGMKIIPAKKEKIELHLNDLEKTLFDLLQKEEALIIDDIALKMNFSIGDILNIVSVLEIKGIIEKNNEGKYRIKFS